MSRLLPTFCVAAALGTSLATGFAAEPPLTQEIHEMRRDLQLQGRKIESLAQEIAKLNQLLQERPPAAPPPAATTTITPPASSPAKLAAEPAAEIPKAEPVTPTVPHVVEKGETLTSIAKHYNMPLADLQKLNKISNDRKLQIGQSLKVPAAKAPETPSEKKETP